MEMSVSGTARTSALGVDYKGFTLLSLLFSLFPSSLLSLLSFLFSEEKKKPYSILNAAKLIMFLYRPVPSGTTFGSPCFRNGGNTSIDRRLRNSMMGPSRIRLSRCPRSVSRAGTRSMMLLGGCTTE